MSKSSLHHEPLPKYYKQNAPAFIAESALFTVALSLVSTSTVLPTLLAQLTTSTVIVGLANGLISGAWLVPQLPVASIAARMPHKKPLLMLGGVPVSSVNVGDRLGDLALRQKVAGSGLGADPGILCRLFYPGCRGEHPLV